jgi:hypothetical protein
MKLPLLCLSLFTAAALCGCAQTHSGHTSAMGANAASGTVCQDGTVLPGHSPCKVHGGVQHGSGSGSSGSSSSSR